VNAVQRLFLSQHLERLARSTRGKLLGIQTALVESLLKPCRKGFAEVKYSLDAQHLWEHRSHLTIRTRNVYFIF
jgi:hypothetical protein